MIWKVHEPDIIPTAPPIVIASMPVKTEKTMKQYGFTEETALNHHTADGVYRNFWSENEWVNDVLKDFTIVEHFVEPVNPAIGNFDEVFTVIKRALSN